MTTPTTPRTAPISPICRTAAPRSAPTVSQELADLARLSIRDVSALVRLGEQTIRDRVKAGRFPAADFKDGTRCTRWSAGSIRRWLESSARNQGPK